MISDVDIPVAVAVLVAACVLFGAFLTMVGCLGLARLRSFYLRIHAPTLGTSFGVLFILAGSVLFFTVSGGRIAVHEVLIMVFVSMTTPVTLMLLARAALYRDRAARSEELPLWARNPSQAGAAVVDVVSAASETESRS
ncbi:MAG: monovalent cation/H(+) antiporter subunit G [Bauldia sp.]|nr:monovalent cation/H(+) antiporter subunit G [Bauldia sp.]MCW5716300.1 monovalent cation/H(+) antiporter subunit G [Bauldia sp.]